MVNTILVLILLAVVIYLIYRVVTQYRAATGTTWQRLLDTARGSATVLWQYVVILGGFVVSGLAYLSEVANMPEVSSWIKTVVQPEYAGLAVAVIAGVSIVARLRTLGD